MSAQPGRDLSLCWEQHRKLLPGVAGVHAETVQHWSVQQVSTTGQRERQVSTTTLPNLSVSLFLSLSDLSVSLQVSDFIESLPGCEEQAKQFRDEVR